MQGLHLTADLRGCPPSRAVMTEPAALRTLCLGAVQAAGLQAVGELFHRFAAPASEAAGITGVVLLAESHLAVHTWPELGAVTLDVYVCNFGADNRARANTLLQLLLAGFEPLQTDLQRLERGRAQGGAAAS
jgi:S-adenosylmethionine decarboxylase proenzyme